MDSKPICHPSPVKKMKCSFLDYIQLLMIGRAGWWTETPSTTPLQPKKWNAHFWITFNFWWSARLLNGLKPHLPPLSSQRMKSSFLDYIQLLMIGRAGWGTQTPSTTPLHPKKWNAHFWITFNFWWLARLVNGLEPHRPPLLSSQKKWNAHFWNTFPSDDLPGWLMNLNLICHPSPTKKMKCSIFDYVQLLMISQAGQLTQSPSATPFQPIKWNASFWIMFTSDDQPGWSMDSNPIHHPSPPNKMKCYFLDYIQLLMISWAGWWTQTSFTTPLQPKKWNAHFLIMFHFWWSAGLVNGLEPHLPALSSQKNEMLLFGLRSTSDDWLG